MTYLAYFEFPLAGPFGADAAAAFADLAADIAGEQGLVWKVWTENPAAGTAGGVYLFTDQEAADRYIAKHTERLAGFGITEPTARGFDVNEQLSHTTHAVLARA